MKYQLKSIRVLEVWALSDFVTGHHLCMPRIRDAIARSSQDPSGVCASGGLSPAHAEDLSMINLPVLSDRPVSQRSGVVCVLGGRDYARASNRSVAAIHEKI